MKIKKTLLIIISLLLSMTLIGCSYIDNIYVKMGMKNLDFEYINEGKVDRIVIQSTRDKGFRFLVNDPSVINDIYSILSKAKEAETKTTLDPDYIFEIHIGEEVKSFYYVTGFNDESEGNFYNDDKIYKMSKRLDNDIIQNLSFNRKPREFQTIYYNSIIDVLSQNNQLVNQDNAKVGIDILGDIDVAKYLLSTDIEEFKRKLKNVVPNAEIMNHNREDFDIIVSVRNYGHKTTVYKSTITIENKLDLSETKFYVEGKYDKGWQTSIYDKMPKW